jgi:hypothetical protein
MSSSPSVTVRDAAGREITLPHYEVLAGYEYRGVGDWIPETDPRVLDWLEKELAKGAKVSGVESINRDTAGGSSAHGLRKIIVRF